MRTTERQIPPQHPGLLTALRSLVAAEPGEAFWLWRLKFRTTDTNVRFDPSKYADSPKSDCAVSLQRLLDQNRLGDDGTKTSPVAPAGQL